MALLTVTIDRSTARAQFAGRDTFRYKEQIKQLGRAVFIARDKSWAVDNFQLDTETLRTMFPGVHIVESGTELAPPTPVETKKASEGPAGLVESAFSVKQFLAKVREELRQAFPPIVTVYGVVSGLKLPGGRAFFDLSNPEVTEERVQCVIWSDVAAIVKPLRDAGFNFEDGLHLMAQATVEINPRGARISLRIVRIVPEYTVGKVAALRDETNKKLKEEGIFDRNRRLPFPLLPIRIGALTSGAGTVIHDFCAGLETSHFGFIVEWKRVAVQGKTAAEEVRRGLQLLAQRDDIDVIALFRGGGSASELAVFSDYRLAKEICLCPKPVLTAIGHHEDQCSAQDVSARSFSVPRALGDFLSTIVESHRDTVRRSVTTLCQTLSGSLGLLEARLDERQTRIVRDMRGRYEQAVAAIRIALQKFSAVSNRIAERTHEELTRRAADIPREALRSAAVMQEGLRGSLRNTVSRAHLAYSRVPHRLVRHIAMIAQQGKMRVAERAGALSNFLPMPRTANRYVEEKEHHVSLRKEMLQLTSPEQQLRRGFALLYDESADQFVTEAGRCTEGTQVSVIFHDGVRAATVGAPDQSERIAAVLDGIFADEEND